MCHENEEINGNFNVLMTQDVRMERRDQIQRDYVVESNETY